MKRREAEAGDEEDGDDEEEELRQSSFHVPGAIMKHHPDMFAAEVLPAYLQLVSKMIMQENDEDRKLALLGVCDLVEHLGTRVTAHWQSFLPATIQNITNPDAELRQPACYAVIWAAKDPA